MEQNNQQPQQNSNSNNNNQNQQKPQNNNNQKPAAMPAKQSKNNLIISGAVIVVVLALLLVVPHLKKSSSATDTSDTKTEQTATATDTKTSINNGSGSVRGATTTQSLAEAVASYQGKMITIGENCSVTPDTQTQTSGTTILINNETTSRHHITVGPKSYTVSGLHYTLSWLNLQPGTLMITCDGKDTKSTITVK